MFFYKVLLAALILQPLTVWDRKFCRKTAQTIVQKHIGQEARLCPSSGLTNPPLPPECGQYLFLTKYEYQILFRFQKSSKTEYWILLVIEQIRIQNTEYYSVSRLSEYQIQIVLFGLTILIPNTKYGIVYKILEKKKLK